MSNELEFQWGLYVGGHMEEPLSFKYFDKTGRDFDYKLVGVDSDSIHEEHEYFYFGHDLIKPQLKSLESLTDEEWVFVFRGNIKSRVNKYTIMKTDNRVLIFYPEELLDIKHYEPKKPKIGEQDNHFDLKSGGFYYCNQQILNRLHSLLRSENEKELLKAELIEIVG